MLYALREYMIGPSTMVHVVVSDIAGVIIDPISHSISQAGKPNHVPIGTVGPLLEVANS